MMRTGILDRLSDNLAVRTETDINGPGKLAHPVNFRLPLEVTHERFRTHRIVVLGRGKLVIPAAPGE